MHKGDAALKAFCVLEKGLTPIEGSIFCTRELVHGRRSVLERGLLGSALCTREMLHWKRPVYWKSGSCCRKHFVHKGVGALKAFCAGKETPRTHFVHKGVGTLEAFCMLEKGLLGSILSTREC